MPSKKNPPKDRTRPPRPVASSDSQPYAGAYEKLLNRLYEPLFVLYALDPVRGEHTTTTFLPQNATQHVRRQFRDDLAFLCEYDKGGDACTALGIEERDDCLVYWVAANTSPQIKIAPFLEDLLGSLVSCLKKGSTGNDANKIAPREHATQDLTAKCAAYALPKIKKLCRLLRGIIADCERSLKNGSFSEQDRILVGWLQQFKQSTSDIATTGAGLYLCRLAYDKRKSAEMKQLKVLALGQQQGASRQLFSMAYHYIGRLAHHVRVPARLVRGVADVEDLLLNPFSVQALPVTDYAPFGPLPPRPGKDRSLLDGIAKRMCKADDAELLAELTSGLQELDQKYHLAERIRSGDEKFKSPRVHAEVQILEHFHSKKLAWADNGDRYIGCSKPACFCCHLYFRHHPLQPIVPACHNKVYLKWGPPLLAGGDADPGYVEQRDLLNLFIKDIRKDAIEQIRERRGRRAWWQADTLTAITQTVVGDMDDDDRDHSSLGDSGFGDSSGEDSKESGTKTDPTSVGSLSHRFFALNLNSSSDSDPDDGGAPVEE